MMVDLGNSLGKNEALADRLMSVLRDRVKEKKHQELLNYLDDLIPPYSLPDDSKNQLNDRKLVYHVTDFLEYFGEEFVEVCYLCLFKRRVDASGLESGLQALNSGDCGRIRLLGRLSHSEEGKKSGVKIEGLWFLYFLARLRRVPLLGRALGLVMNFDKFIRLDLELEKQNADIFRSKRTIDAAENAMSDHYNELVQRLGSSGDGLTKFSPSPGSTEHGLDTIAGLQTAYRSKKVLSMPLIGFFVQLPRALGMLSRLDSILEYQSGEIAGCKHQLSKTEARIMSHYNKTLIHLKRELVEALKDQNHQK